MTDPTDQLYLDGIRAENGEMVIDLHDAGQTLAHMALAVRTFWEGNASEGTNYVQTGVRHEGKTWNFVVYPSGKPTPHDLRRKAEAERDQAVDAIGFVKDLHASDGAETPFCGECGHTWPCLTIRALTPAARP